MVMSVEVVEDKWREPTQALADYAQNSGHYAALLFLYVAIML